MAWILIAKSALKENKWIQEAEKILEKAYAVAKGYDEKRKQDNRCNICKKGKQHGMDNRKR